MARSHREWCKKVCTAICLKQGGLSLITIGRTWRLGRKQRKRLRRFLNTLIGYLQSGQVPPLLAPRLRGEIRLPRLMDGDPVLRGLETWTLSGLSSVLCGFYSVAGVSLHYLPFFNAMCLILGCRLRIVLGCLCAPYALCLRYVSI